MRYKSIFYCTADPTKNAGNLKDYFIENTHNFIAFHFFLGYSNELTYFEKYINGKLIFKKEFSRYTPKNKLFKNVVDYAYFCYVLLFYVKKRSYVYLNAPTYCFLNSFFRLVKSVKYVLRIDDYYPKKSLFVNLYDALVNFYNKNLNYIIYISPPISKTYSTKRKKTKAIIPLGIKKEFEKNPQSKLNKAKIRLGFIGIIREQQGLDLLFSYLSKSNDCILDVIGDGYKLAFYKKLAQQLGIKNKVTFYGKVDDIAPFFKKWDIGIALYENRSDNLSIYCEPTKVKHYLSYGIPVITTRATYFSSEVTEYNAGCVIDETTESLQNACDKIIRLYSDYIKGVNNLVRKYSYSDWYQKNFKFLEK